MEELYQLSNALAAWLQTAYPQFLGLMTVVSALGSEEAYLVILPAVYWSIDKRLGRQLGYLFLFSTLTNNVAKGLIRQPRPFWIDPDLQLGEVEGFGIPSGHVQNATVLLLLVIARLRRAWLWVAAAVYILLMGLSRFYLGLHFLQDIVGGFFLGLLALSVFVGWQRAFGARFAKRILGRRLLMLVLVPIILGAIYVAVLLIIGPPNSDVAWTAFLPAAVVDAHESVTATVAGLLAFGIGMLLESSRIRFRTDGPLWQRVARYVVGIVVALGIWGGLRAIFPAEPLWLALPLRFLRYFLLLLWVTYFGPWVFVRLRLAQADPDSEVRITL
ncbi:putative Phosphoesterase, PA-phosphatase related [Candidatus Promineifilum breve]|uniref:Phosphoesterase, PA-phosphatase related n=1 Tax=Candidatus Promineifilum breve TaxID=1806508 RepID=A0A160T5H8_9CHLR|nr:phosphatase PAP2 family protein [Candidatus Promineifilum breve]CUS04739.2 putative Phosphoesterase, PA-phosphatase related [Candidatus Promineifilum breve]